MKNHIVKRLGASVLSGLILTGAIFPVYAAKDDDEPYTIPKMQTYRTKSTADYSEAQLSDNVVEYGEIDFLVRNYNNTIVSNRYTYTNLRNSYEEAEGTGASSSPSGGFGSSDREMDKALDNLNDGIRMYRDSIKKLDASLSNITNEAEKIAVNNQIASLQNSVATLEVQKGYIQSIQEVNTTMSDMMGSMANGSGMSASDLRNYYLQFAEAEATIVKAAQGMYPTYYQLVYNLEQLNANLEMAQTAYQGMLVQKELGMCTDNDVADSLYNVTNLQNSISNLENQMLSLKQEFCKLIGRNFNEEITFGALPEVDYDYIASIDLYQDIETALANNYTVNNKKNVMSNYGPGSTSESRTSDRYALDAERENVRSEVNKAYLDIQTKKTELEMAREKYANEERQMKKIEEQYNLGMISKLEYEQKKVSFVAEETNCKTAESALLDAVNTYRWILAGL